jgi:hypothetical protein
MDFTTVETLSSQNPNAARLSMMGTVQVHTAQRRQNV